MTTTNEILCNALWWLIPLIAAELTLKVFAILHIASHKDYKVGNRTLWIVVTMVINTLGSLSYFIFGLGRTKREE